MTKMLDFKKQAESIFNSMYLNQGEFNIFQKQLAKNNAMLAVNIVIKSRPMVPVNIDAKKTSELYDYAREYWENVLLELSKF